MAVFTVSNTGDLEKYLAIVKSGDTIKLAPGTYSNVLLQNVTTSNVTITSQDPNHPAVLTDLLARNLTGFTFSNLEMSVAKDMPFQFYNDTNIVLDHLDVHGSLDGTSSDDNRGMIVRNSSNVTVSNSYFHELTDALSHMNDTNVTFTNNRFQLIRDDGIIGGGSSNITISNNVFTDFDHTGTVHPDMIQFFTSNATNPASNITVTGNVYNRGSGTAVQGIWIKDDSGKQPYKNVTVTNNVIVGAVFNGLVINGAQNATVTGNVVIGETGQNSWIGLWNVAQGYEADNIATTYANMNSNVTAGGDVIASYLTPTGAAAFSALLAASSLAGTLTAKTSPGASAAVLAEINQIGYVDGNSPTGATHAFGVVQVDGTIGADRLVAGAYGASHLYGYAGNDTLSGGKDGIASTLEGGPDDDCYNIYQPNDVVIENANSGNDSVYTYVDYTLPANVETMYAVAAGLTLHSNPAGGRLVAAAGGDTLIGGIGADILQGASGNDTLIGGGGNDKLAGNDGNDVLTVASGNNTLLGGNGNDTLNGGSGNDTLDGGAGNDVLRGGGGSDMLTGGAGADRFVFDTAPRAGSIDTVTDFTSMQDVLQFSKAIFTGVAETGTSGAGTALASASELLISATATVGHSSSQHFIYNSTSGILYYDATGTGSSVAVAQLGSWSHPTLSYSDIHIIA